MPLLETVQPLDADDQRTLLNGHIEETTEYYIICDECRGCTDLAGSDVGMQLHDEGWRLAENERGREFVFCPTCATPK